MAPSSAPHNLLPKISCNRSGSVATEFALCVPVLLLFTCACADFGRIAFYSQVVSNAARTGAEHGATHGFTPHTKAMWEQGVRQAVISEMQHIPGFDVGECALNVTASLDSDALAIVDVDVSYPFRTVVAWPGIPSEVLLHKQLEFRQFR